MTGITANEAARALARVTAEQALDLELVEFDVTICVTQRAYCDTTITAASPEEAVKIARTVDTSQYRYDCDRDAVPEGDEIAFVKWEEWDGPTKSNANTYGEEEVNLKQFGEPFSWDACRIVKDLAQLVAEDWPEPVASLIKRADETCFSGVDQRANAELHLLEQSFKPV